MRTSHLERSKDCGSYYIAVNRSSDSRHIFTVRAPIARLLPVPLPVLFLTWA
jgi:hypothetical protein